MAKVSAASTQQHLPLAGIQDGVIIMNDGSVRAVLKIEPINFDLKSENLLCRLEGHDDHVKTIQFTPENHTFASFSADGTVRTWSITDILKVW